MKQTQSSFLMIILLLVNLTGCGSHQVKVTSEPSQAEVSLILRGQPPRNIGITPLEIPHYGTESYEVAVVKKGYETVRVVFPAGQISTNSDLFIKLPPTSSGDATNAETLQKLARGIAEAKNLIEKREFDLAESKLNVLSESYPSVSVIQDLIGNIYFIRKDFGKALAAYRRSDSLSPGSLETTRMIRRIEELRQANGGQQ